MKPEECMHLSAIFKAMAEGKKIRDKKSRMPAVDISWTNAMDLEIAPEQKLRPWKPEEVPVGAVVNHKDNPLIGIIGCVDDEKMVVNGYSSRLSFQYAADKMKWKWPQEPNDAWRPCGVVE